MEITTKLRSDHDALLRMIDEFCEILAPPAPPAPIELVKFRHAFSKQLLGHLTREDWLLYPFLLQSSDKCVAATAQIFINEMGGLSQAYKAWSTRWPTESACRDWDGFVTATADLLSQLAKRIDSENEQLYPLVESDFSRAA